MFPEFTLFGKTIPMYAMLALCAGLLVGVIFCRRISKLGYDDNDAIMLLLISAVGVLLGGMFLYGVTHIDLLPSLLSASNLSDFISIFNSMFGGSVFYGGLFGGLFFGYLYASVKKLDKLAYTDAVAPLIPLFHGIARVGCFFGGCCYGIESDFGYIVQNNVYLPELNGVRRFPVQLLEALGELMIFFLLNFIYLKIWNMNLKEKKMKRPIHPLCGCILPMYFLLYPILRFCDEFLRGDSIRGFVFNGLLSTSQLISIILFMIGIIYFTIAYKTQIQLNAKSAEECSSSMPHRHNAGTKLQG